jgi:SAM-dependent methyltransferase
MMFTPFFSDHAIKNHKGASQLTNTGKKPGDKIMLKRIPHENKIISGKNETEAYVQRHRKHAASQYGAFMKDLGWLASNQLPPGSRFLEVGPGPGFLTASIAEKYPHMEINALEPSGDMIAVAEKVVGKSHAPGRIRFIKGKVEDESLVNRLGKFDLVYSTFSLHHWEDPVRAIRAMHRILSDRGVLMLHDFKRVAWLYWLPLRNGFVDSIRAAYRKSEIKKILAEAGIGQYRITTRFPYFWSTITIDC